MSKEEHVSVPREWYLASLNDGLFIIDQKPSSSGTDVPVGTGRMNPSVVLNVTDLQQAKAQALVDAHNVAILSRATPSDDDFYCCNGVDCGCQGITKREYAEACSKKTSAPRVVTDADVERACNAYLIPVDQWMRGAHWSFKVAMRAALESFVTSLPAARVPDEAAITIQNQGVLFGKWFWVSHEKLTGCTVKELNERSTVSAKSYMKWVDAMIAAAPQAGERG